MNRILAVDTTSEWGSIALVEEQRVVEELALDSPDGFAHVVFGAIEQLLARHGLRIDQIDAFASASGPGSFTGVRIGLASVKGLAEATGRKVAAVSNLQALAWHGTRPLRATLIDARRGEIYGAVYDDALHTVCEETVTSFPKWLAGLPEGDLEIIAFRYPVDAGLVKVPVVNGPRALAGAVGRIANQRLAAALAQDPAAIDANYIRRSDAELLWKE